MIVKNQKSDRDRDGNNAGRIGLWVVIGLVLLLALFRPLFANDQPLIVIHENGYEFPAFRELPSHWMLRSEPPVTMPINGKAYFPIIAFHPQRIDLDQRLLPPGTQIKAQVGSGSHWLGTDQLGRDVLAGIIHGLYIAIIIGLGTMLLAFAIAIPLGWLASWTKKHRLSVSNWKIIPLLLWLFSILAFHNLVLGNYLFTAIGLISSLVFCISFFLLITNKSAKDKSPSIQIPFDRLIFQFAAIIDSIPGLLWVLILGALFGPSLSGLILIIAWVRLPEIIRVSQLEADRIQILPWSEAAIVAGIPTTRIWWKHWWPAQWPVMQTIFLFGVISGVVLESTLSFLGLGLPYGQVSWGTLINGARTDISAWWLVLFPGIMLLLFIQGLRALSRYLAAN